MIEPKVNSEAEIKLSPENLKTLKGLKVGGKVRVVLTGAITEKSEGTSELSKEGQDSGSFKMTVSTIRATPDNEITELFEDDVNG